MYIIFFNTCLPLFLLQGYLWNVSFITGHSPLLRIARAMKKIRAPIKHPKYYALVISYARATFGPIMLDLTII